MSRISQLVRVLLLTLLASLALEYSAGVAEARAGGRRSMGRTSRPAQGEQYRQSPSYQNQQPNVQPQSRGGFGRALAGGIAGGFLGSMLFSSLGHAAPGAMGAGGGGVGLIEIILIAGLAFLAFRWWKAKREQKFAMSSQGQGTFGQTNFKSAADYQNQTYSNAVPQNIDILSSGGIDQDEATDIFFRIQGAFTRRDLSSVAERLTTDMYRELGLDLDTMKIQKKINRLENISVRRVEVLDRWNESGREYARVRFTANLLDYTVDEASGQILEGSAHEPVKFEEDWTFTRANGYAPWQLAGISQI